MSLRLATVYHRGDPHGHRHPGHPDREAVIRPGIRREDNQLGDSRGDAGQPGYRAAIVRRAKRLVLDASTSTWLARRSMCGAKKPKSATGVAAAPWTTRGG